MSPRRATAGGFYDPRLADLEYLRKGAGLTPARLATKKAVLALLGTHDAVDGVRKLDRLLADLSSDRRCTALRAAFGADSDLPRLGDRRRRTAATYGKSPDTIRDWEDQAIREVLLLLLAEDPEPPLPTPPFLMEYMSCNYLIVDRHFVSAKHRRDVVVLAPEAGGFRYGLSEDVELQNVWGADAVLDDRTPTGPIYRMRFPTILARGARHSFGWEEVRRPAAPPPPMESLQDQASQIFHMPATKYDLSVTFQGQLPRVAWRFEQLAQAERPGRPENGLRLRPDASGKVATSFQGLHGGFCSGAGWRW